MTVPGDHWPIFLYAGDAYDADNPWKGLLHSQLLISVRDSRSRLFPDFAAHHRCTGLQACFYVPQLGGERSEGNAIRQRTNTRNDTRHSRIDCIYCYTGKLWHPTSTSLSSTFPGPFQFDVLIGVFSHGHDYRLGALLWKYPGIIQRC
jgi:hypothetical protein